MASKTLARVAVDRRHFLKLAVGAAAATGIAPGVAQSQAPKQTSIGDLFADDKILSVAHAYQTSTDWHLKRPDLSGLG